MKTRFEIVCKVYFLMFYRYQILGIKHVLDEALYNPSIYFRYGYPQTKFIKEIRKMIFMQ